MAAWDSLSSRQLWIPDWHQLLCSHRTQSWTALHGDCCNAHCWSFRHCCMKDKISAKMIIWVYNCLKASVLQGSFFTKVELAVSIYSFAPRKANCF